MTYDIYLPDFDEEFEATIVITFREMKDILTKAQYESFKLTHIVITDNVEVPYIPKQRDINIDDFQYTFVKRYFSRWGILDSLKYLPNKK